MIPRREHKKRKKGSSLKNGDDDDIESYDNEGTEEMFDVEGGTEYQEIPMIPDAASTGTTGVPSEHTDPVVKRKRRNRRKNKKYKICPPTDEEEKAIDDLLMRVPRHIIAGPPVTPVYWTNYGNILLQSQNASSIYYTGISTVLTFLMVSGLKFFILTYRQVARIFY